MIKVKKGESGLLIGEITPKSPFHGYTDPDKTKAVVFEGAFNFAFSNSFNSDVGVDAGEISSLIYADTDYVEYERGFSGDVNSGSFELGSFGLGFRPVANPVPLPATAWLFLSALGGLVSLRYNKS